MLASAQCGPAQEGANRASKRRVAGVATWPGSMNSCADVETRAGCMTRRAQRSPRCSGDAARVRCQRETQLNQYFELLRATCSGTGGRHPSEIGHQRAARLDVGLENVAAIRLQFVPIRIDQSRFDNSSASYFPSRGSLGSLPTIALPKNLLFWIPLRISLHASRAGLSERQAHLLSL